MDFFFAILCFFCYTLPCFLLVLGDWAYRVICFVVYCYLFILFFKIYFYFIFFFFLIFFYLHGFSGFIFRKFNCSWHFFTSSDRVSPGGVHGGPRFADWYRGVVSYTSDDLGGRVAWLTWNWWNSTEETVDDGLGRRYLGAGRCLVAPPPWLVMAGRSGRWCQLLCFFFFFLSFENPWWLMAERLVLFVAGGSEGPHVGKWIPQCFLEHYSCYDTDRTAEITDAPTS